MMDTNRNLWNAVVVLTMTFCITIISVELKNTIVLGWLLVPGILHLFNIVVYEDEKSSDSDEEIESIV